MQKNKTKQQQEQELRNYIMTKLFTFEVKSVDDGIYNKLHKKGEL